MNDEIFAAMVEQMKPDAGVLRELNDKLAADDRVAGVPASRRARRRWRGVARWGIAVAAAVVAAALVIPALGRPVPPSLAPAGGTSSVPASDYGTLYRQVLRAAADNRLGSVTYYGDSVFGPERMPVPVGAVKAGAGGREQTGPAGATNVQVPGIDEGDIVKSDGRTIFVASGSQVALIRADGARTRRLSVIDTRKNSAVVPSLGDPVRGPVVDMMLSGTTLAVFVTVYDVRQSEMHRLSPGPATDPWLTVVSAATHVQFYDVADPSAPRFLSSLSQSGGLVTTRLLDGVLFLVTDYQVRDRKAIKADDPRTFVPLFGDGVRTAPAAPGDCYTLPTSTGADWAVVSSIDFSRRARIDSTSVFGGAATVYLSTDSLYLAGVDYPLMVQEDGSGTSSPKTEPGAATAVTHLARISIVGGQLAVAAERTLPGTVLNQFALDELDGKLRIVTTIESEDAKHRVTQHASLSVLDADLKTIGSLSPLVRNEEVRSVRFDGAIGYVVTFRQIDPLFAVDLADPAHPRVVSELKLPGFSSYLQKWGDRDLLGLGVRIKANEPDGLKLAMFDVSNPLAVRQASSLAVAGDDAEALSDHRAVLVDQPSGLVGFAVTEWKSGKTTVSYRVFRYDPASGFIAVADLPVRSTAQQEALSVRGLLIGDHLYVASSTQLVSYQSATFSRDASVAFGG